MFLNLAKGQEDLKALILKDKKKKKRPVGVLNLGRSFKGPVKHVSELATPSRERETIRMESQEKKTTVQEGLRKMKLTILRSSILLLMTNTNS